MYWYNLVSMDSEPVQWRVLVAYLKVDGFNILPVMSFSMAATTFTGQNYGAGKTDRIRKGLRVTLGMSVLYTIVTGILLLTFSRPIIGVFSSDKEVIYYGAQAMKYFCRSISFWELCIPWQEPFAEQERRYLPW